MSDMIRPQFVVAIRIPMCPMYTFIMTVIYLVCLAIHRFCVFRFLYLRISLGNKHEMNACGYVLKYIMFITTYSIFVGIHMHDLLYQSVCDD